MAASGRLHSVESFGTVDGPGIRFIAFMQGCVMRCQYCHNRDSWDLHGGQPVSVDDLMAQVRSYRPFYDASGGGVTASGGEAILQPEFVADWFDACQREGLHTCLDTNGYVRKHSPAIDRLIDHTDLVMLDIKQMDDSKHIQLTKISNRYTLNFARYLAERGQKTWIRYVVVDGFTADTDSAQALADFIAPMQNVDKVELLPYHELGKHKWHALGADYLLEDVRPPSAETLERISAVFTERGLNAVY